MKIDTNLFGIWKAIEDTDSRNFILIQDAYSADRSADSNKENYEYYVTYFNMHGENPLYQQWNAFISTISGKKFLNFRYYNPLDGKKTEGYFFVRLVGVNSRRDSITTAVVADSTLRYLHSSEYIRSRISMRINDPALYSDTVHFFKLYGGRFTTLRDAVKRAN